jgi:hypothetical protein
MLDQVQSSKAPTPTGKPGAAAPTEPSVPSQYLAGRRLGLGFAAISALLTLGTILTTPAPASAWAYQSTGASISGRIVDAVTEAPLPGTLVILEPHPGGLLPAAAARGASVRGALTAETGADGRYQFNELTPGAYRVHVRRIGYHPASVELELRGWSGAQISVALVIEPIVLQPIEVTAGAIAQPGSAYGRTARSGPAPAESEGAHRLAVERLRQRVHLTSDTRALTHSDVAEGVTLGETDLFRALQRFPGIGAPDEYSAELWVRGAPWDQTRIYFDGLPLFNPLHAWGLLSGVNTDAIGAAFLHPGVQPVMLGGGAAGTLDLRSRRGGAENDAQLRGIGELSLASMRLALDGATRSGQHRWLLAGRRTYLDWLTRTVERISGENNIHLPYAFYDVVSRYDYQIDDDRALEVSGILEFDAITGDIPDIIHRTGARWGGGGARITLRTPLAGLEARQTVGFSGSSISVWAAPADSALDDRYNAPAGEPVRHGLLHLSLSGEVSPRQRTANQPAPWSAGYELIHQRVDYRGMASPATTSGLPEPELEWGNHLNYAVLWGTRRWQPNAAWTLGAGLRLEGGATVQGAGALRVAPRLTTRYAISPALSVAAAAGRSYQYEQTVIPIGVHVASGFDSGQLWILAGENNSPARSDIATLGAEAWLGERWLSSVNGYLRWTTGLGIADPTPGSLLGRPVWVNGTGSARGVELSLRRLAGRMTTSFAYAYALSELRARGYRFPAPTDRRHTLSATTMLRLGRGWQFGAAYTAASGIAYTRSFDGQIGCTLEDECFWVTEPWVGEPGAMRGAALRGLDLLVDWNRQFRRWNLGGFLQLRNALGRSNNGRYLGSEPQVCYDYDGGCWPQNAKGGYYDDFLPGLPLLPLLGFRVNF